MNTTFECRSNRGQTTSKTARRDEAEKMLRDLAFVLHLTEKVKNEILQTPKNEATALV